MKEEKVEVCFFTAFIQCVVSLTLPPPEEKCIPHLVSAGVSWSTSSCRSPTIFEAFRLNTFQLSPSNRH